MKLKASVVVLVLLALLAGGFFDGHRAAGARKDITPPSTPANLHVTNVTPTSVAAVWDASFDNVGVKGYYKWRDGVRVADVDRQTSYTFTTNAWACGQVHELQVAAFDRRGNVSPRATLSASTSDCSPPPPPPSGECTTEVFPGEAIQSALASGAVVCVHAGTYVGEPNINVPNVTLLGYPGEPWPVLRPPTGLSGDHYPLRITADNVTVTHLVFERAYSTSTADIYGFGGADDVRVIETEIRDSQDQGVFIDDTCNRWTFLRNRIHNNGLGHTSTQHQSHGLYLEGSGHVIASNLVYDQPFGFGMQLYPVISNTLVTGNTVVRSGFSGIIVGGTSANEVTVRDNIVAFNRDYGLYSYNTGGSQTGNFADHNVFFQNGGGSLSGTNGADFDYSGGNLTADPLFAGYPEDLHLQSASPAVDYGLPSAVISPDFDGTTRPQGAGPDAGAYER